MIRPAVRADVPWVAGAMLRLGAAGTDADARFVLGPEAPAFFRERVGAWFDVFQPFPPCVVAERGGTPVGFLAGAPAKDHPILVTPRTAVISDLWVEPDHRRHGLARALVERFHAAALAAGYPRLEVSTLALDLRAVAFWRSIGFADLRLVLDRS